MFSGLKFYFSVQGKKYYSDIEAAPVACKLKEPLVFHLNYDFIQNANWQKEPVYPIHYYLDLHSRILNEKYDQIILMYSGGTDSHTALESFIRCKIKNIILYDTVSAEQLSYNGRKKMNEGVIHSLKKYSQQFKDLNYKVMSPKVDSNDYVWSSTPKEFEETIKTFKPQKFYDIAMTSSWYRLYTEKNNHIRIDTSKKKTAVVYGFEKPMIGIRNNYWEWYMPSHEIVSAKMLATDAYDDVFFFITDDVPEIQIKLAWLKIEILERLAAVHNKGEVRLGGWQTYNSPFYEQINEYMGYKAVNALMNSAAYKPGSPLHNETKKAFYKLEHPGIKRIIDDIKASMGNQQILRSSETVKIKKVPDWLIQKI